MGSTLTINNRYQLIEKLGQGGMGTVYKAYDRLEKIEVALKKVLLPEKQLDFASKPGTDNTEKLRLSLAREFSILARLRHPHILSVLDFGFDEDKQPFYTMTLLEGATDAKTYGINLSNRRRIVLMGQMLQALHYLHRRGVLHRDLKPQNVFVTRDEQVKVMDFGLAQLEKAQSSRSESLKGTISYMAPEQFQGKRASVASDLFAIGVMVYEIMAGQHPFEAKTLGDRIMKIMMHTPDLSAIPVEFAPWLKTILEKDPTKRFASAYDAMVEFYKVFGREVPAEDRAIRESFLQASTFVGRDIEFKQLTDALDNLSAENAFFLIGGESGVGKSRLLGEFRIQALVKGATVVRGQAIEGGGLPFQVWRNITRRLLLIVEVSDLQASILKDLVPDVGELLGRDIPDAPELTGKAYQERLVATIVDLLRECQQPIVLVLEDLHWAVESLQPLRQILLIKEQLHQLMIVASYRDDEAPELPDTFTDMTPIRLARLDETAVRNLSVSILGERGARPELVQMIQTQSEGNTFFIIETVRALAEELGSLEKVTISNLPAAVLTANMQQLMQRRLSKIEDQHSEIQTLAAVIGRELDLALLHQRFDESRVQAWLNDASNAGVLEVQENTWRFSHDKLRETVLAGIPDDELPTLHRAAAETIETVYPDDDTYNETLLGHWREAGNLDKELSYLDPVAESMIGSQGDYLGAIVLLEAALALLNDEDPRRSSVLNHLADAHEKLGQYSKSIQYAEEAYGAATRLGNDRIAAISLNHLGNVALDHREDFDRATELFQKSLDLFRKLGDLRGTANSLSNLGIVAAYQGNYDLAADRLQQSLAIREELGDQRGISISLNNLGVIAQQQQDYDRAADLLQQSLGIHQRIGDQNSIATSLNNLGVIANGRGDYDRASDLLQESLTIFQQLGKNFGIADSLIELGRVALNRGDMQVASGRFSKALHIAQQIALPTLVMRSVIGLAIIRLHHSQTAAAQLAGCAMHHPAFDTDVGRSLNDLLPKLEAALSPEDLHAALERGKELDLDTVVQELLAEFGGDEQLDSLTAEGSALDLEAMERQWLVPIEDGKAEDTASEDVPEAARAAAPAAPAPDLPASSTPESDPAGNVRLLLERAQATADPEATLRLVAVAHVLATAHKLDALDASADTVRALTKLETSLDGAAVRRALDELMTVNIDQLVRELIYPPASDADAGKPA